MNKTTLLCLVLIFAHYVSSAHTGKPHQCPKFFREIPFTSYNDKDREVKSVLETSIQRGDQFHVDCPLEMVKAGLFEAAETLIQDYFLKKEDNLENHFKFGANSYKNKLDNLHKLSLAFGKSVQMAPAFKWGQSLEEIVILVKFANRIDSPGCLDVSDKIVEISKDAFLLKAKGVLAGSLIDFKINFTLYADAWGSGIKIENAGVGAVTVRFKKKRVGIWPQLWKIGHPRVPSANIWWDLKGKEFDEAMATFERLHQRLDSMDDDEKSREYKPSVFEKLINFFKDLFSSFFKLW